MTSYIAVPHEASKEAMMGMEFPEFIVNGYIELNKGFECGFADISTNNVELPSGQVGPQQLALKMKESQNLFSVTLSYCSHFCQK